MDPVHVGCAHGAHLNNILHVLTTYCAQQFGIEVDGHKDYLSNGDNFFVQRRKHDDSIREMRADVGHLIRYHNSSGHVWIRCNHEAIAPALDNYFRNGGPMDADTNFLS